MWKMRCFDHVGHNGLHWGCRPYLGSTQEQDIKDLKTVFKSCVNGYAFTIKHLPDFIAKNLAFCEDPWDFDMVFQWWVRCGLAPDIANEAARLNIWWDRVRKKLFVDASVSGEPLLYERVTVVFLAILKLDKLNDGRWNSMGTGFQQMSACLFIGYDVLVEKCLEKPNCPWELKGFRKLSPKLR